MQVETTVDECAESIMEIYHTFCDEFCDTSTEEYFGKLDMCKSPASAIIITKAQYVGTKSRTTCATHLEVGLNNVKLSGEEIIKVVFI